MHSLLTVLVFRRPRVARSLSWCHCGKHLDPPFLPSRLVVMLEKDTTESSHAERMSFNCILHYPRAIDGTAESRLFRCQGVNPSATFIQSSWKYLVPSSSRCNPLARTQCLHLICKPWHYSHAFVHLSLESCISSQEVPHNTCTCGPIRFPNN